MGAMQDTEEVIGPLPQLEGGVLGVKYLPITQRLKHGLIPVPESFRKWVLRHSSASRGTARNPANILVRSSWAPNTEEIGAGHTSVQVAG